MQADLSPIGHVQFEFGVSPDSGSCLTSDASSPRFSHTSTLTNTPEMPRSESKSKPQLKSPPKQTINSKSYTQEL